MELSQTLIHMKNRGFEAEYFENSADLVKRLSGILQSEMTVGFGGSHTLRQLGIPEMLETLGITTLDHWKQGLSKDEIMELRLAQGRCDLFITSANACTEDGRIVLVDGVGNRVAATIFGPKEVLIVVGTNKFEPDIHGAFKRIREKAGPMRAASLKMGTPCVKTGICEDCRNKDRICRAKVILDYAPFATPTRVWIVEGNYGY